MQIINDFENRICGQKVAVIGIGVSNVPLIRFLIKHGAIVNAYDKRTKDELGDTYSTLLNLGVNFVLGNSYLDEIDSEIKLIFKTPGVRFDVPAIKKATNNGAKLSSEMELFFDLCPADIIAVTGSDGKTTTTSLINDMLERAGYKCYLGGNIGRPLIEDVEAIQKDDKVIIELSSFQLHTMRKSPKIAVVTNITPNHLDWHTDFDEYITAKKTIFTNQKPEERVVLNFDNEITRSFITETENYVFFSRKTSLNDGYCLNQDNIICYCENGEVSREILDVNDIYIPGVHNIENYMAAIAATDGLVNDEIINQTAKGFKGVPHRIEFVRELDGVRYYNDSIASSPARTTAGLNSFGDRVILIAGGYDKKIPFDEFGTVICNNVKEVILCGFTADKIEESIIRSNNYNPELLAIYKIDIFEDAIKKAKEVAENGDIVLLSPACASFDMFKNFEERGNTFKRIVNSF